MVINVEEIKCQNDSQMAYGESSSMDDISRKWKPKVKARTTVLGVG